MTAEPTFLPATALGVSVLTAPFEIRLPSADITP